MAEGAFLKIGLPFLAGVLPAVFWLWFWLKEDLHPEPKREIFAVFLAGALSTMIALPLQKIAPHLFGLPVSSKELELVAFWATAEELAKYIAAALIALRSRYFDEPVDAMIYMLTAALGFAAFENMLFLIRDLEQGGLFQLIVTGHSRFLGATLLHIVASTIVGGALALAFYKTPVVRIMYTTVGLLIASGLHALFNFSIMKQTQNDTLSVILTLWLSVFLVFLLFEKVKHLKKPLTP